MTRFLDHEKVSQDFRMRLHQVQQVASRIVENPLEPRLGTQARLVESPSITHILCYWARFFA